ncbi:hypothetical protein CBS101457_003143 [Exobasidium rhododendri]|nr:hypothetical protein CBS101457_003143 [Exobasidium rhododendri]
MPESSGSGRCEPVTGDTSHSQLRHQTSRPAVPMQMMPMSASSNALDNSTFLPPSPPSTPTSSPQHGSWLSDRESVGMRENMSSNDEEHTQLRQVLQSMARQEAQHKFELPETPESTPLTMSPAELLILHRPNVSAQRFTTTILPRLSAIGQGGRRYLIEDAGMELVCPGWTGAVLIDTKPSLTAVNVMKSKSMSSSISSSRMSHSSSSASNTRATSSKPRRILLTKIAASLMDTKDLRSSILDALDHATEKLQVENVVFVLDRTGLDDAKFRAMVHGLCYVGASIVGHGSHGDGTNKSNNQASGGDEEEDVHAPRQVSPGLVLLSVDV